MSPVLAEDSVLLTLPFGGAVLQKIGATRQEIDAILEDFRKVYMDDYTSAGDDGSFGFLDLFRSLKEEDDTQDSRSRNIDHSFSNNSSNSLLEYNDGEIGSRNTTIILADAAENIVSDSKIITLELDEESTTEGQTEDGMDKALENYLTVDSTNSTIIPDVVTIDRP